MEPELREAGPFTVVGLKTRTSNAAEADPSTARIPALWRRFHAEDVQDGIPSADGRVLSVYTEYESDHRGAYSVVLGRAVERGSAAGGELSRVDVPRGRYLVFTGTGPQPEATIRAWAGIWEYFAGNPEHARAYTADFELHEPGTVRIHVAVR